ncbi:hypothetical protein CVS40_10331 [Lucilia cuprina]|nr:hypothetical protein CVS40_10331 [Lucilia cuprina]
MINALHKYCQIWCLKANLTKSKIIVFRSSPRISSSLKWHYGDEDVEIVNSYKYLGVDINFNLSFNNHLKNKLSASKLAINTTWSKYINNPKISKNNKLKIFQSASRSIMFYAAQIWGYTKYDIVEKLFKFFIKKMLYLPRTTPNYMLHPETGLDSLYISILKLHFAYINKVLNMHSQRLPRILAQAVISQNVFWANEWTLISRSLQFIPENNNNPLCTYSNIIVELMKTKEHGEYVLSAENSHHDMYSLLNYNVIPIFAAEYSTRATCLLMKVRCGLLNLNGRAYCTNIDSSCTMCNLDEVENTYHFIGVCPIYKDIRKYFFGKIHLYLYEVLNLLNGSNFYSLYKYTESALRYRMLIANEFNA